MKYAHAVLVVPLLLLGACQAEQQAGQDAATAQTYGIPAADPAVLGLAFSWHGVPRCTQAPPAFRVTGVPPGTATLRFRMHDLQKPDYPHGGGTVPWRGDPNIPAGAFRYHGPCPPPGATHQYRWTVQALSASDHVLGEGSRTEPFPPR